MTTTTHGRPRQAMGAVEIVWPDEPDVGAATTPVAGRRRPSAALAGVSGVLVGLLAGAGLWGGGAPHPPPEPTHTVAVAVPEVASTPSPEPSVAYGGPRPGLSDFETPPG